MVLCLCGCDSSDYKKAVSLMESGDYAEAEQIFSELGDYENSAEMLTECRYAQALELFEQGEYKQAYPMFRELGDYKDSKTIMKSLPGYILVNWLKAEGDQEFKSNNPEYSVRLSAEGDDAFCMEYHFYSKDQYGSVVSTDLSLLVTAGEKYAEVSGEGCLSFIGGQGLIEDTGSGKLDISLYTYGNGIEWDEYEVSGKQITGIPLSPGTTGLIAAKSNNALVERAVLGTAEILGSSGLGLSLEDLGFSQLG